MIFPESSWAICNTIFCRGIQSKGISRPRITFCAFCSSCVTMQARSLTISTNWMTICAMIFPLTSRAICNTVFCGRIQSLGMSRPWIAFCAFCCSCVTMQTRSLTRRALRMRRVSNYIFKKSIITGSNTAICIIQMRLSSRILSNYAFCTFCGCCVTPQAGRSTRSTHRVIRVSNYIFIESIITVCNTGIHISQIRLSSRIISNFTFRTICGGCITPKAISITPSTLRNRRISY